MKVLFALTFIRDATSDVSDEIAGKMAPYPELEVHDIKRTNRISSAREVFFALMKIISLNM